MALGNAFTDPDDVSALLLLQLEEGVEHSKVELLHEGILVQPHLKHFDLLVDTGLSKIKHSCWEIRQDKTVHSTTDLLLKEFILQGLFPRVGASSLKALLVLTVVLSHLPHL